MHWSETKKEETTLYLHGDALGSTRVVTGGKNGPEHLYFEPFGQRVEYDGSPSAQGFTPPTEVGFTGHRHDDELELINMGGRVYDPAIRRFLTPDPFVTYPHFGQSYNRYSYALGNPLSFVDPTGFNPKPVKDGQPLISGKMPSDFYKASGGGGKPRAPAAPTQPKRASSDAQEASQPTGASAQASQAEAALAPPAAEAPASTAAPVAVHSAPVAAGEPGPPVGPPPPEATSAGESWRGNPVVQIVGGYVAGVALGLVPGGGLGAQALTGAGVLAQGTRPAQIGRSVGEMVGGVVLMLAGAGGSIGGGFISLTGVGAAVGVPAAAVSAGLVTAGAGNLISGAHGLGQALSTGGGGKAPDHHIATNKNNVSSSSGGPWTPRFEKIFKRAGMDLEDAANIVAVPGHKGPHPAKYHQEVFRRLTKATKGLTGDAYSKALRAELDAIRTDILTPGSELNNLLTGN